MKFSREKLAGVLSGEKSRRALILCGAALMLLLLFSTPSCSGKKEDGAALPAENAAEIEARLERRLSELISGIDGAGKTRVMVTLDAGSSVVYEKDKKLSSSRSGSEDSGAEGSLLETEVVLAGSAKQPLQISTVMPTVRGAAVVCEGADDPAVRAKVANTVAKALNIGISRVYVTR